MGRYKMKGNITLKQYIDIVEKARSAVLYDLDKFDTLEMNDQKNIIFSVLGVKLQCRDDEDCFWVSGYDHYMLFLRFDTDVMKYIREESECLLEDDEPMKESAKDRLYWEVTKYTKVDDIMCRIYDVYFSLDCKLLGVCWHCHVEPSQRILFPDFYHFHRNPEYFIKLSAAECFLRDNAEQLDSPLNVELPYRPGDILYIDARPFGKPFYAVYCAETDAEREHFEWTLREYGYYKRTHPCLYISQDHNSLDISNLTNGFFTDHIAFTHAPLDKIKKVDTCDDQLLLKASAMLKADPEVFRQWVEIMGSSHLQEDTGLEQWISM